MSETICLYSRLTCRSTVVTDQVGYRFEYSIDEHATCLPQGISEIADLWQETACELQRMNSASYQSSTIYN